MAQLGLVHTDTLLTKGNLAILLKQLGSGRRRSGCLRRMVVAGQTAQPRLDHTSNLATKDNLVGPSGGHGGAGGGGCTKCGRREQGKGARIH